MIKTLAILLRVAGVVIILLAGLHVPIGRRLNWREEALRMSPVNASVFRVHAFFICVALVMMGLPCIVDPSAFLVRTRAGCWLTWSCSSWWTIRLYFQWFVYPRSLWRGKKVETSVHFLFTIIWLSLAIVFAVCGAWQMAWLD
jgi:hypothetical protein